jgi:hypothetical protein
MTRVQFPDAELLLSRIVFSRLPFFFAIRASGSSFRTLNYARLAQSVERQALNLMVVGSSPTVGVLFGIAGET